MPTAPRKPLLVNLAWAAALVMLLAVGYVLSYPMAVRRMEGDFHLPAYIPVEWLVDNTALREPIYWWADLCGAGRDVRNSWARRQILIDTR